MTTLSEDLKVLRRVPLFAALDRAKLELIAFTSEPRVFADGDVLFETGSASDSVFVVLQGQVRICVEGPAGATVVDTASCNELVGEIDVLQDAPHSASALAQGTVHALRIPHDHFLEFLSRTPKEAREVMRQLSAKLARYHANARANQG